MPSNKTLTILVICFGIVISVYLLERNPNSGSPLSVGLGVVPTQSAENSNASDDWKRILVNTDQSNLGTTTILTNNDSVFDETTLTAQMAKDFFSQYLLLKKGGASITPQDAVRIATNLSSSPQYTKSTGAVYIPANLHIINQTDTATIKKYKDTVNLSLKTRSSQILGSPVSIVAGAVRSENENDLLKLDPIIVVGKGFISDFLNMDVPSNAVTVHLGLLNAFSNILSSLQAMRMALTDPVRGMAGVSQYNKDLTDFQVALKNINAYFDAKIQ